MPPEMLGNLAVGSEGDVCTWEHFTPLRSSKLPRPDESKSNITPQSQIMRRRHHHPLRPHPPHPLLLQHKKHLHQYTWTEMERAGSADNSITGSVPVMASIKQEQPTIF